MEKILEVVGMEVVGLETTMVETRQKPLAVKISNDNIGKTISITNGFIQFTIPFEPLEPHLKGKSPRKRKKK